MEILPERQMLEGHMRNVCTVSRGGVQSSAIIHIRAFRQSDTGGGEENSPVVCLIKGV